MRKYQIVPIKSSPKFPTSSAVNIFVSGRCPAGLTLDLLSKQGYTEGSKFPTNHGHAVSVPGAAAAWIDTVEKFGSGKVHLSYLFMHKL